MTQDFGKVIIILGVLLVIFGVLFSSLGKIPFLGKLPGDIMVRRDNFTFFAPLGTSILVSVILTLLLNLFFGAKR